MICPLCQSSISQEIVTTNEWKIISCLVCSNAWTDPSPNQIKYEDADFHDSTVDNKTSLRTIDDLPQEWKSSIIMQSRLVASYLPPGAKVLEIGCGEGILLSELKTLGFQVKGIEPSLTGSERARKKGLDVITGYFPHSEISSCFDAVIMSHVLEHIEQPTQVLKEVAKIAPNGYLLLVQTNYKGLIPRYDRERWYAWAANEHYWHFTPKGLQKLTNNLNFNFVCCQYSSLVHQGRLKTILKKVSSFFPSFQDQFHLLFKIL